MKCPNVDCEADIPKVNMDITEYETKIEILMTCDGCGWEFEAEVENADFSVSQIPDPDPDAF